MTRLRRLLAPLVAIPHSTIAIGLVFLLAPSGWLMRLISPILTGLDQPPTWGLVPDPYGFALVLGLVAKELPFLLLLSLSTLANMPLSRQLAIGAGLGYGHFASWVFLILPLLYRRIRLPIIAVLIFSLSVVDMALLLAPSLPPPLAILVLNGFHDANLDARLPASFEQYGSYISLVAWLVFRRKAGWCGRQFLSLAWLARAIGRPFFETLITARDFTYTNWFDGTGRGAYLVTCKELVFPGGLSSRHEPPSLDRYGKLSATCAK